MIRNLYSRYNEVVNKQPFVVSHDLLKKIKLKTDDNKVDNCILKLKLTFCFT